MVLRRFSFGNSLYFGYTADELHVAGIGFQVWASIHILVALVPVPQYPGSVSIPGCQINHDQGPAISVLVALLVP
jgi:hypothetical protein